MVVEVCLVGVLLHHRSGALYKTEGIVRKIDMHKKHWLNLCSLDTKWLKYDNAVLERAGKVGA